MPDVRVPTAEVWTTQLVEHGVKTGHTNFAWDDTIGSSFGLRCLDCDTRYVLSAEGLKSDPSPRAQILYHGLRTQGGRETMLATIRQAVKTQRQPKNAWDLILRDDDD